jgi:hypothetical protein
MIVVVEADRPEDVIPTISKDENLADPDVLEDRWLFGGEPWRVEPVVTDKVEFDTDDCIAQREAS